MLFVYIQINKKEYTEDKKNKREFNRLFNRDSIKATNFFNNESWKLTFWLKALASLF